MLLLRSSNTAWGEDLLEGLLLSRSADACDENMACALAAMPAGITSVSFKQLLLLLDSFR
jgi:hypothetical protein